MFAKNKRGALELSITGIVVLIIAITLLGFAIFFIKQLFGGAIGLIGTELDKVKTQLLEAMKESGEGVALSQTDIEIKRGRKVKDAIVIGIRNDFENPEGTSVCYAVGVRCLKPFTPNAPCFPEAGPNEAPYVGGIDLGTEFRESVGASQLAPVREERRFFPRMLAYWDIENFQYELQPADLQITRSPPDTYLMELLVFVEANKKDCASANDFQFHASKRFRITVT